MRVATILFICLSAASARAEFAVDMSPKQLREAKGTLAIEDLAIEETGVVLGSQMCFSKGNLYIARAAELQSEATEYGISYRVTRKQGNAVTIKLEAGAKMTEYPKRLIESIERAVAIDCDVFGFTAEKRFEVLSINGKTSARELISSVAN